MMKYPGVRIPGMIIWTLSSTLILEKAVMLNHCHRYFLCLILILCGQYTSAQSIKINGQLSGWTFLNESLIQEHALSKTLAGFRYLPTLDVKGNLPLQLTLESEVALNIFSSKMLGTSEWKPFFDNEGFELYRFWGKLSGEQSEIRIGLQQINFGPGVLLRPLRWFDSIDPFDPNRMTNGVYGALGRCYFLNNANIWLWLLSGNDRQRGWDMFPGDKKAFEYGGRFQYPLGNGEMALSWHHRRKRLQVPVWQIPPGFIAQTVPEDRIAFDGKWDLGISLWFENTLLRQSQTRWPFKYRNLLMIGADYTVNWKNGLHVLAEHFYNTYSSDFPLLVNADRHLNVSGMMLNYTLNLLDDLTLIMFQNWDQRSATRSIGWKRAYTSWRFHVNLFWNSAPPVPTIAGHLQNRDIYNLRRDAQAFLASDSGLQVMIVFNH